MRDLIDKFNKLLNETDYSHLNNKPKVPEILTEASMSRILSLTKKYDCAIITAFRDKLINCLNSEDVFDKINIFDNKGRNKALKAHLLYNKYALTNVKGNYIENYVSEKQKELDAKSEEEVEVRPEPEEKSEDSLFVVNINDDPKFIENIIKLGKLFCQDAVMIFEKESGSKYLYGTNNSPYPGLDKTDSFSHYNFGDEAEFMTKVKGRPFHAYTPNDEELEKMDTLNKDFTKGYKKPEGITRFDFKKDMVLPKDEFNENYLRFEHFSDFQNSSKYLISELSKKISRLL
jgi:hypothetical protein